MFNYEWHGIYDVLFVYEVEDITTNASFSVFQCLVTSVELVHKY